MPWVCCPATSEWLVNILWCWGGGEEGAGQKTARVEGRGRSSPPTKDDVANFPLCVACSHEQVVNTLKRLKLNPDTVINISAADGGKVGGLARMGC